MASFACNLLIGRLGRAILIKDTLAIHSRGLSLSANLFQNDLQHKTLDEQNKIANTPSRSKRKITSRLEFIEPQDAPDVSVYSVLNHDGSLTSPLDPSLTTKKILEMYEGMVRLNTMDKVMFDSHRQGRISFYMTSFGEEAIQFGSAAALEEKDWIFAQYREVGPLLYRKMPLNLLLAQCYGNREDLGKGRQMPIHYGNKALNYVTVSSPLATQMPQAVGCAYALKRDSTGSIVICYFGEGASSEGDAHAAMNFATTLDCPVLFFCRNNGYAISTPTCEQYRSDGIVTRGLGYGMRAIRVDGNDLFAVYMATKSARQVCAQESRPVLLEAMSYRVGHHSTSDDSTAYRSIEEIRDWEENDNPLKRVFNYLRVNNLWSEDKEKTLRAEARAQVIESLNYAEKQSKLPVTSMFEDVYKELPNNLRQQQEELRRHLEEFGDHYPIKEHEGI